VSRGTDTNLVFRALIMLGLIAFGFFLASHAGLIELALGSDKSYISYVIVGVYALASGHWLWLAHSLGQERRAFAALALSEPADGSSNLPEADREAKGARLLAQFQHYLERKRLHDPDGDAQVLVAAFADDLVNRHAFGHFLSDVLLKLGLLGTVVGFILMLLPIGEIQEFDPSVMRELLAAMSSGMAVALYTTLAGLITSTLLKLQYHVLDASAADLATRLSVLVDVQPSADAT
jgi:hypothetical protein